MTRAALLAALVLLAGCGGGSSPSAADVRQALEARLSGQDLSYRWVYCAPTRLSSSGRTIFHCNVNFGEPHVVVYCATLDGDRLTAIAQPTGVRCSRSNTPS